MTVIPGCVLWRARAAAAIVAAMLIAVPRPVACQQPADAVTEAKRLRDLREYRAAAAALVPYLRQYPDDAGVHWLRAQLLEWSGQRAAARQEYERTLALTPPSTPAADSLARHAADLSSTWLGAGGRRYADDQTLHSAAVALDAGRYVSNDVALTGSVSTAHFAEPDATTPNTNTTVAVQGGLRGGRGTVSMGGDIGIERASMTGKSGSTEMIGNAWAAINIRKAITIAASITRAGYHWTTASIDTAFVVTTSELSVARETAKGVAGRVAIRREAFADGNAIRGAYGWLLLPVSFGLRAGYAGEYRDARVSQWNGAGYDPYYTPENVRIHSVIGEWSWRDFRNAVQVNGGYGFSARELAPYLLNPSGKQTGYTARSYTPWNASISASRRITYRTSLRAQIDRHETAFYHATSMQLGSTLLIR